MQPLQLVLRRFRDLPVRQQALAVGSLMLLIVVMFLLFTIATRTPHATVTTGLDPADAPEIAQALSEQGIENRITQGGTAVTVPESELDRARAVAATSGTGKSGGQVGFELFDKNNLGATDFQQRVQYQRALEGEIARTIQEIDGVQSGQVQLVLPKDQLFTDDGNPASASVLLETNADMQPQSVTGIARLVQTAVEGIKPENITITDQSGRLLWPNDKVTDPSSSDATDKQKAEERYANNLSARLNGLLTQTLGANKAQAQVTVDLNVDQATKEKLTYGPKKGQTLAEKSKAEKLRGNGAAANQAGTDANIPTYGQQNGGSGSTRYDNDEREVTYGVDKEVTKTQVAPGQINRLQVAVLVDRAVPAADVAELQRSLGAAAGIDPQRGDQLALSRVTFTTAKTAPQATGISSSIGSYIRTGLIGVGLLMFAVFVWRSLRRRDRDALGQEPVWLHQIEIDDATEVTQIKRPRPPVEAPERTKAMSQEQVEMMADRDPAQMAQQLRSWLNEQ